MAVGRQGAVAAGQVAIDALGTRWASSHELLGCLLPESRLDSEHGAGNLWLQRKLCTQYITSPNS